MGDAEFSAEAPRFQDTRWSVVVRAGGRASPDGQAALESLCETYWRPLYAYARRRLPTADEARDMTQAFFLEMLEKNTLAAADRTRGRFRAFLLTAFQRFLLKQWDRARALKRGGGRLPLSLDFAAVDSQWSPACSNELTPEQHFERQWALTLLERTLQRLAEEWDGRGHGERFQQLKPYLLGDAPAGYATVAERLGVSTAAAKVAVSRMRSRYRALLREEIAQTVAAPEEIDQEIRDLFAAVGE